VTSPHLSAQATASGGISFTGLLTVVFITLKLLGFISWSWWYVTILLWLPAAIILGILALFGLGVLIYTLVKG
jgi:hypothetical protein